MTPAVRGARPDVPPRRCSSPSRAARPSARQRLRVGAERVRGTGSPKGDRTRAPGRTSTPRAPERLRRAGPLVLLCLGCTQRRHGLELLGDPESFAGVHIACEALRQRAVRPTPYRRSAGRLTPDSRSLDHRGPSSTERSARAVPPACSATPARGVRWSFAAGRCRVLGYLDRHAARSVVFSLRY